MYAYIYCVLNRRTINRETDKLHSDYTRAEKRKKKQKQSIYTLALTDR